MGKTPKYDQKIKEILGVIKPKERICPITNKSWMMTQEEIDWCWSFNVPPSKYHPETRWKLMAGTWVGYQWWYQKHPKTGKLILTPTHPSSVFRVLPDTEWHNKDWSSEGIEAEAQKSFFDQYEKLIKRVPFPASRNIKEPENSIAIISLGDQNSYFVNACRSKNSIFGTISFDIENSMNFYASESVNDSYFVVRSHRVHKSKIILNSFDILNSAFLFDCRNCEYCFGATNKRNKKYIWMNQEISKGEWESRFSDVDMRCRTALSNYWKDFNTLMNEQAVWPENFNENITNSSGEYLDGGTNLQNCFVADKGSRDQFWCSYISGKSEQNAFVAMPSSSNHCYYSSSPINSYNCLYTNLLAQCENMEYSDTCYNSKNCFGCIGLNYKEFHIFNKPYTEDEYWKRLDEIKCAMLERGKYGEFFPLKLSPSYILNSGAVFWFGATKEQFEKLNGNFFDPESNGAIGEALEDTKHMRNADDIPDCVEELDDDWLGIPIYDKENGRRFAFIRPEIEFYKKQHIAVPNRHFISRMKNVYQQANIGIFEESLCSKCGRKISIAQNLEYPDRTIYYKKCYFRYLEEQG